MTFDNKGRGPKGGRYLVCSKAKRRLGCRSVRWRYDDFETSFLAFVTEINLASLLGSEGRSDERRRLEVQIAALEGELASVVELMEKTYAILQEGGPIDFVTAKLRELEQRRVGLTGEIAARKAELEMSRARQVRFNESKDAVQGLLQRLRGSNTSDAYEFRAKVASHLKSIRGEYAPKAVESLKMGTRPPFPYSDVRLLPYLQHSFWFLPNVAACHAMANLTACRRVNRGRHRL
jgi:hypothetical protein